MAYREKKVADALKNAVANIILKELADPNLGFVTVTSAWVSKDLKDSIIYLTVLGDEKQVKKTLDHINRAKGYIKHRLIKFVPLKRFPEINFELDKEQILEAKIGKILDDLYPKDQNEK